MLVEEIGSFIADAANTSLSDRAAAARILARVNGASPEQLIAAAIGAMRDAIEQIEIEHYDRISLIQMDIDDLRYALRARNVEDKGSTPPTNRSNHA